jgi:hypothetical protein
LLHQKGRDVPSLKDVHIRESAKRISCFFAAFSMLLLLPNHHNLVGHPCLLHKKGGDVPSLGDVHIRESGRNVA